MKKYLLITLMAIFLASSCKTSHVGHVPPGQAKKITGSKSAKAYAPGQRKKINE
jgi:hypothetical protein